MHHDTEAFWQTIGGLVAAFLVGVFVGSGLGCGGQGINPVGSYPAVTYSPLGIAVSNGNAYNVDMVKLDAAWIEEAACWGYAGYEYPTVRIVPPVSMDESCQRVAPYAYGQYVPGMALLPPDLCAARHEFAHHISYVMTGNVGANYSGRCSL